MDEVSPARARLLAAGEPRRRDPGSEEREDDGGSEGGGRGRCRGSRSDDRAIGDVQVRTRVDVGIGRSGDERSYDRGCDHGDED